PETPAGHAVRLGHAKELYADLTRPLAYEKTLGPPPIEHEVAVGEIMQHPRTTACGPLDGVGEDPLWRSYRGRVRRIVQVEGVRWLVETREGNSARSGERDR